ncbi:MAG TPA: phosphatase PAP2 family protein [Acidothermaceae bacterium]|jgi:undecaprenyl-diphosphatase
MAPPPLLRGRRLVAALIGLAALGVAILGVHYADESHPGRIDSAIDSRVRHRLRGQLRVLHHLVALADPISVVVGCAALAAIFFVAGRRRAALLAVLGPACAAGIAEFVLKPLINRRINDALSFPSGHTTAAVSVAIVIAIALLGPSRPPWPPPIRFALSALALVGAAAVATALVGSGYHYSTDTVGGFCVAIGVVLGVAWGIDAVSVNSEHDPPRAVRTRQLV